MEIIEIVLVVLIVLAAAVLTAAVLSQKSKNPGLSGAISGNSSESYYGKGKTKSREQMANTLTIVLAVFFVVVVLAFYIIQPFKAKADYGNPDDYYGIPEATDTTTEANTTSTPDSSSVAPSDESDPSDE